MKAHYYPETDSIYVDLQDGPSVDSREIAPGVVADFDEHGNVVGLDIDRALRNRYITPEMMLQSVADQIRVIEEGRRVESHPEIPNDLASLRNSIAHATTTYELFATLIMTRWLTSEVDAISRSHLLDLLHDVRGRLQSFVEADLNPSSPPKKTR